MKLTTLILILAIMQVSAVTRAQKVTLAVRNAPISTIFQQIRSQTGYDFAYTTKTLENTKPVTLRVSGEELKDVLDRIFDGQPIEYAIDNKLITVSIKEPSFIDKIKEAFEVINASGRVLDENNQPLSGATVQAKGTNNATITNANGFFTLKNVQPGETLVISFIGYDKKELPAAENLGVIKLTVTDSKLDEVKVIAYGQTTQRYSVGDVSSVSAKDIEKQPVSNPLLALEGQVPGVFITQSTGLPGTGVNVLIRGQNSIANGTLPFYVVDGVPYTGQLLSGLGSIRGTTNGNNTIANGNPLDFISPNDIESISILKDASATSIYGSRAANGAILITTKKGKAGDTRINFNVQHGVGEVAKRLPLMDNAQYLQMRHEGIANDKSKIGPFTYDLNGSWDTTRTTDWQKTLIGRKALYDNANLSISGGSENTQYLLSGTYHRETTVFPDNFADWKGAMHFSLNNSSANKKFKVRFIANYMFDDNELPVVDLTAAAMQLPPIAPPLYGPNGSINWQYNNSGSATFLGNPIAVLNNHYSNKTNSLESKAGLNYELAKGLTVDANLGYTFLQANELELYPLSSYDPISQHYVTRRTVFGNSQIRSWLVEPRINYQNLFLNGRINAFAGATFNSLKSDKQEVQGSGYADDQLMADIFSASTLTPHPSLSSLYRYNAFFAGLNYIWRDKFIIDAAIRRDGSSRFGIDNRFHNFWSVGAGWIFSEEPVVKNNLPWLSFGKLRGSYGTTGNDQVGDYSYLSLFNSLYADIPYQGIVGLTPSSLSNPYLQWEETRKLEGGVELGFFNQRLLFSLNYYRNCSSNQLLLELLPSTTGFSSISTNIPATVQNYGWEFTATTQNIKSTFLKWLTSFNLTIPKNKLVRFDDLAESGFATFYKIGEPITTISVFHYLGVDPATGYYQFATKDGGVTQNPSDPDDQISRVNTSPKFYGGLQNTISFKEFSVDFGLQFVKQTGVDNSRFGFGASYPGRFSASFGNQPAWIGDRWQKPGDYSTYQKYAVFSGFGPMLALTRSDASYVDASYIRLKNVSFSWQLPERFRKKISMQSARIFLQGQNIFTITGYKGLDPESLSSLSLPPLRIWTIGVQAGF